MADTYYLWSRFQNGGEVMTVKTPQGVDRNVVSKRNVLQPGEKVTQAKLEASDEQWQDYIDNGVVRTYPYPDDVGPTESPLDALRRQLREASQSEEERLIAAVQGVSLSNEELAATADEAPKK